MRKVTLKSVFLLILVTFFSFCCNAAIVNAFPHHGEKFEFRQPDGQKVSVSVFGDEYYQRVESIDGYTLIRAEDGKIFYARLLNGILRPTTLAYTGKPLSDKTASDLGIKKGLFERKDVVEKKVLSVKQELQTNASSETYSLSADQNQNTSFVPPAKQAVKGLVILVDFPDIKSSSTIQQITDAFNKSNSNSVYDHFYGISSGIVSFTNNVVGFYTAKYNKNYYDSGTGYSGSEKLSLEVINWLKTSGVNFSDITVDSNNVAKAVSILYAGTADAGWANGLWPHTVFGPTYQVNGIKISKIQFSDIGKSIPVSTINHECEHMILGWPDYYDYQDDSNVIGSFNNGYPNAYSRCVISKWYEIKWLNGLSEGSLVSIPANTNEVFGYSNPTNQNEMFLIENIMKEGNRSGYPGSGLLIWHIDKKGDNSKQDMTAASHYVTSIEQADGRFDLEKKVNNGDANDFFKAGYKAAFTDSTVPNSKWWNGSASDFNITEISSSGKTMTFKIGPSPDSTSIPIPVASLASGTYSTSQSVSLSDSNKGVSIYYTIDGSAPTSKSTLYTSPVAISVTSTLKAVAIDNTGKSSDVLSVTYVISQTPVVIPGDVNGDGKVDVVDAIMLKSVIIKKNAETILKNKTAADMNNDGTINSIDYLLVKKEIQKV